MKTEPNSEAFPYTESDGQYQDTYPGLTKREYFSACALQGMNLSIMTESMLCAAQTEIACESAVKYADDLIKALNKPMGD